MPPLNFFSQLPSVLSLPATLRDDPYLFGTSVESSAGEARTIRFLGIVQTWLWQACKPFVRVDTTCLNVKV